MIEAFWDEFNEREIHARDSLQFELKSEFHISPRSKKNVYKQEVYIFIPSALQVNAENYSKEQFYLDQTNLIRYKTPVMTLTDLGNPNYFLSPLNHIDNLLKTPNSPDFFQSLSDELKLFAAIFRGAVRERIYQLIRELNKINDPNDPNVLKAQLSPKKIIQLLEDVSTVILHFRQFKDKKESYSDHPLLTHYFRYIDEFISTTIDEFLVIFLKHFRSIENNDRITEKHVTDFVIKEHLYRQKENLAPKKSEKHPFSNESILLRRRLLRGFVLESLLLKHIRFSPQEKHRDILGGIIAGIAMLFYMSLLVWKSSTLVMNSFPFVALAVFLYIIKDRMKEGFKILYAKQAHRWFPDYSTEITNFKGFKVGKLTENFSFTNTKQLPAGFLKLRNNRFHEELQALHRHETIIQYKREVTLYAPLNYHEERRREMTTIFRLNIHHILQKASDPFQEVASLNILTQEIVEKMLPKVYHLSIIIRNTVLHNDLSKKEEIKTYRVVVDKNGIKRVEHVI